MNINFYWNGDDFQYLNRLTLLSHIIVGHHPIIWLEGNRPNSIYWIDDIPEIEIKNAREIYNTCGLLNKNINVRTISDLFSYYIVYKTGEYYADTDAIAIKSWPDQEMVIATYDPSVIAIGVFRFPKNYYILDKCIKTHITTWGNVRIFTKIVRNAGLDYNVPIEMFYPIHCDNNKSKTTKTRGKFLDNINLPDNCVSYHYYSNSVHKVGITHEWVEKKELKNSLFVELSKQIFEIYPFINKKG